MLQLPYWFVLGLLIACMVFAFVLFVRTREDVFSDPENCMLDDPKERLREIENAFASGLLTREEYEKLSAKLGGDSPRKTSGISSKKMPKTWDDVQN